MANLSKPLSTDLPGAATGALLAGAAATVSRPTASQAAATSANELSGLLEKLPGQDYAATEAVCESLLAGGAATLEELVRMVGEVWVKDNAKAQYALHGLVVFATRPGADPHRRRVSETLARHLAQPHPVELKAFLIRQLQVCGGPEVVPALREILADEHLCEPATQTLLTIGGEAAAEAVRTALPNARGRNRVTLILGLAWLRDEKSAPALRAAAAGEDDGAVAAWHALGSVGDAEATNLLLQAARGEPTHRRDQATAACLLLGRRLAEKGRVAAAEIVLRGLLDLRQGPAETHERCAVLDSLVTALGVKALPDLTAAFEHQDVFYRNAAGRIALSLARTLLQERHPEAGPLLDRIRKSSREEAVRHEAESLRATLPKAEA